MERINEIEERLNAIKEELTTDGADLDALEEEVRSLKEEKSNIMAEIEKRNALINEVAKNHDEIETPKEERKTMTELEIRQSAEYVDAYAKYIKTGKVDEVRSLLTTNVSGGTVPVPTIVEKIVKTAWEKNDLMARVRKTYLSGNVKVAFEISSTGAVIHTEGTEAPAEETLVLGIVTMIPQSIKKWIRISDEALDLGGEAFLQYIYEELTYRIAKKCADELVSMIKALPTTATSTSVSANQFEGAPAVGTIAQAIALTSDEVSGLTIVMNKQTWGAFKSAQASANYGQDIFEGCEVVFNNTLPAYADATDNEVYAIVGDFYNGSQANFPNGEDITIKYDDMSEAEADLVKIVGREFVGLGVIADKCFVNIIK